MDSVARLSFLSPSIVQIRFTQSLYYSRESELLNSHFERLSRITVNQTNVSNETIGEDRVESMISKYGTIIECRLKDFFG